MSALTDYQLRQELSKFGENVPPITTRNREQLRARLELLRSAKPKGRTSSAASPSRARNRSVGSPRRTTPSRISTRSKGVAPAVTTTTPKKLIELSDSEVESPRTIQTRSRGDISVTEDVEQSSKFDGFFEFVSIRTVSFSRATSTGNSTIDQHGAGAKQSDHSPPHQQRSRTGT